MPLFRLFVDDSGNREYDLNRRYDESSGKTRYFVYGALLIEDRDASLFATRLQELKRLTFGQPDVEIKSNWLRMPESRAKKYLQRFGIDEPTLTRFVDDYYRLVVAAPVRCIGAIVDKLHMQETYSAPWYAPTAAYEVLMQRAVRALSVGDTLAVTMDDITGKTPKAHEYKELLTAHHDRLRKHGSVLQREISFKAVNDPIRFMNSAHSDLVQVADVVAYNLFRQFRDHGPAWETPPPGSEELPTYPHFQRICGKFYADGDGRVQGFGIVKFPLKNQVKWKLTDEERNRKE